MLNAAKHARFKEVLKFWIDNDMENIFRIKCGNHHFQTPCQYQTNTLAGQNGTSDFGGPFSNESFTRAKTVVKELLSHITTHHFQRGELVDAAI